MASLKLNKQTVAQISKYSIILLVLIFMRALVCYTFINSNGFAPGGMGGIASIIHYAIENGDPTSPLYALKDSLFDPGIFMLILNVPLLILAFILLNRKFAISTTFAVLLFAFLMFMFARLDFPQYNAVGDSGLMLIAAIAGGVGGGISLGFMLRANMSSGGTDILGSIIYKYNPSANVQWWIAACDCVIATASGLLGLLSIEEGDSATDIMTAIMSQMLYSFISLFSMSKTADIITEGLQSSLVFNIITQKTDEMAKALSEKIKRGVTITRAMGYYSGKEHDVIICVTSKKQITRVKQVIASVDDDAFTYITKANEVSGLGFSRPVVKNSAKSKLIQEAANTTPYINENTTPISQELTSSHTNTTNTEN